MEEKKDQTQGIIYRDMLLTDTETVAEIASDVLDLDASEVKGRFYYHLSQHERHLNTFLWLRVAELNKQIIGFCKYFRDQKKHELHLSHMAVTPEFQSRHIVGPHFMDEILCSADLWSVQRVILSVDPGNERAIRFYRKHLLTRVDHDDESAPRFYQKYLFTDIPGGNTMPINMERVFNCTSAE